METAKRPDLVICSIIQFFTETLQVFWEKNIGGIVLISD